MINSPSVLGTRVNSYISRMKPSTLGSLDLLQMKSPSHLSKFAKIKIASSGTVKVFIRDGIIVMGN